MTIQLTVIDKVSQNEWESFSDLFEKINEKREILFDDTNWKLSKCSCCYWLKNYMCSHIIILAVTLKLRIHRPLLNLTNLMI